jgi:RNA-binding protein YhbY
MKIDEILAKFEGQYTADKNIFYIGKESIVINIINEIKDFIKFEEEGRKFYQSKKNKENRKEWIVEIKVKDVCVCDKRDYKDLKYFIEIVFKDNEKEYLKLEKFIKAY